MKKSLIVFGSGFVSFILSLILGESLGDLLAGIGVVLIGIGTLGIYGKLQDENYERLEGGGKGVMHETHRGGGPFGF